MPVVIMDLAQLGRGHHLSRLDENEVYDDKFSDEDEKHTISLSTKQSSKNSGYVFFFLNQSARNTSKGRKGLR